MLTMPIEAGYDDATITLRTSHRDLKSPRNYQNLHDAIGLKELRRMFGDNDSGGRGKYKNAQWNVV